MIVICAVKIENQKIPQNTHYLFFLLDTYMENNDSKIKYNEKVRL